MGMRITAASLLLVLIAGMPSAPPPTAAQSPSRGQATRLHGAEQIVDSVMNRVHQTHDFEPVLIEMFAPETVKGLREQFKADPSIASDRDLLRMYSSTLTILYLSQLLLASLEMNGVDVKSGNFPDNLPPDLKAAVEELSEMESRHQERVTTAAEVQEFLKNAENLRTAMIKHIRADVLTSEAYKKFVEGYRHDSQFSSGSSAPEWGEPTYQVWREGLWFVMVERAGTIKIGGVSPVWLD